MKYLSRRCMEFRFSYALCLDEKTYKAELRRLKIFNYDDMIKNAWSSATVHKISKDDGTSIALVCLGSDIKKIELEQVYALLVHEAVHLWQWHCELIGEHEPSCEFEAYGIQALSQELMFAYKKATKKK